MEKATASHRKVLELTLLMIDSVRSGDLEGVISLERKRNELLRRVCEKRGEFFASEEGFEEFVKRVMELDEILGELVRQEKDKLATQLSQLQGRRKAAAAYVTAAN